MAYHESIRKLVTTDTNHADTFNYVYQQLLDNTVANKEVIESINTTLGEEELSTTSQNVKGAINEVLDNTVANTEAIENIDLSQYTKTYRSLTEINPTFTVDTPIKDVILAMEDNSMAVYELNTKAPNYYNEYGIVTINKVNDASNKVSLQLVNNRNFTTNHHPVGNPNCEWTKLLTDEELHIPNNPQPSYKHFVQAWGGKYFSTSTEEKDLNNVFDNIMCYTTMADELLHLPDGESGGSGWFKSETNFKNFNANQHTLQTYANTDDGGVFLRCYNQDFEEWTEWKQLTSEKKVDIPASMLKNGWTLKTNYDNSYVVTDKTVSLNLSMNDGTLTNNTVICEGLPRRNQSENVPIILRGINGTSHIVFYTTDGKLTLSGDVSNIGSWGFINATINL